MSPSLLKWIGDADALRHMDRFGVQEVPLELGYQLTRKDDLYISLVGELFDRMRDGKATSSEWACLGNALAQYGAPDRAEELRTVGISQTDATVFASAAFYFGGFPASAYLTMRSLSGVLDPDAVQACFDLLARPRKVASQIVRDIHTALLRGDLDTIAASETHVTQSAIDALEIGPDAWIPLRLLQNLLKRFRLTNLRGILPDGDSSFWTPLISSLVRRGSWDFFPSQITAIQKGLLMRAETFSLQMPTGAGKTTLCETLLFHHLKSRPNDAAVLLVPYRSLASELRYSLVRHLNDMGISARCAYGGTVPSGDEVRAFDETRALIATPETLSGILSANAQFARRISLVICDEGHLLDAPSRGVGLELLLARMKVRVTGVQRYVFLSAIVPNIEEINAWLGGGEDSVVRSDYRPALAEFAVLRSVGQGALQPWDLEMHPHEQEPVRYRIERFLRRADFRWRNTETGKQNTYPFNSFSCRAIATARKSLSMGAAVVFAANKRGDQGAIGLAHQLLRQMERNLPIPKPLDYGDTAAITPAVEYLENEYGNEWVGTQTLKAGAILHHGDIPQETREILERLLRNRAVALGICTSTLAEGVNLPIRTLVLYSVQRLGAGGTKENLLTRDIKNLVGRAGRAGATTKGLVICVNPAQWPLVAPVAQNADGEPVIGALRLLIERVSRVLAVEKIELTNELMESIPVVHSLIDGIDATLVDLAATEIGETELLRLATNLADQTFASRQTDDNSKKLLRDVFGLRALRISALHSAGRVGWIKETGIKVRMVNAVESGLLPARPTWDDLVDSADSSFVGPLLEWAWLQAELQEAAREAYRIAVDVDVNSVKDSFFSAVRLWLSGSNFMQIAYGANLSVDDLLGVHTRVIAFALQTIIEQGVALLEKLLESRGQTLAPAVLQFPEHLRFGVLTVAGCALAAGGLTHRRAFVAIGNAPELQGFREDNRAGLFAAAQTLINGNSETWAANLGSLVFEKTLRDLSSVT